jgi:hypothetical protein
MVHLKVTPSRENSDNCSSFVGRGSRKTHPIIRWLDVRLSPKARRAETQGWATARRAFRPNIASKNRIIPHAGLALGLSGASPYQKSPTKWSSVSRNKIQNASTSAIVFDLVELAGWKVSEPGKRSCGDNSLASSRQVGKQPIPATNIQLTKYVIE